MKYDSPRDRSRNQLRQFLLRRFLADGIPELRSVVGVANGRYVSLRVIYYRSDWIPGDRRCVTVGSSYYIAQEADLSRWGAHRGRKCVTYTHCPATCGKNKSADRLSNDLCARRAYVESRFIATAIPGCFTLPRKSLRRNASIAVGCNPITGNNIR